MPRPKHSVGEKQVEGGGTIDRRTALVGMSAVVAAAGLPRITEAAATSGAGQGVQPPSPAKRVRKIATEEAFMIPEVAAAVRDVVRRGGTNLDLKLLATIYDQPSATPPNGRPRPSPRRAKITSPVLPACPPAFTPRTLPARRARV
jgi:5-carboxyvanillate decarboxylase